MHHKRGIERLLVLYNMVEKSRSLELRIAASALAAVEKARSSEAGALSANRTFEVEALKQGDPEERMIAQSAREASVVRLEALTQIYAEREEVHEVAEALHHESRLMKERIESVAERKRLSTEAYAARKTQGESDDRYASRHSWNVSQARQVVTRDGMKAT